MLVFQLQFFYDMNLEGTANPRKYQTIGKLNDLGTTMTEVG